MNTHEIIEQIEALPKVVKAVRWTKAGHDRLYLTVPKYNGGASWNGGEGCRGLYADLKNMDVVEGQWAGARTRKELDDTIRAIWKILGY